MAWRLVLGWLGGASQRNGRCPDSRPATLRPGVLAGASQWLGDCGADAHRLGEPLCSWVRRRADWALVSVPDRANGPCEFRCFCQSGGPWPMRAARPRSHASSPACGRGSGQHGALHRSLRGPRQRRGERRRIEGSNLRSRACDPLASRTRAPRAAAGRSAPQERLSAFSLFPAIVHICRCDCISICLCLGICRCVQINSFGASWRASPSTAFCSSNQAVGCCSSSTPWASLRLMRRLCSLSSRNSRWTAVELATRTSSALSGPEQRDACRHSV